MQGRSKTAKEEKHPYRIIDERLSGGTLRSPLFLYGQEEYLIRWSVSRIIDTFVSAGTKQLDSAMMDGIRVTLDSIIQQCETLPILSKKRVVVIRSFAPLAGDTLKGFSNDDEKSLAEYLLQLPETCFLIFTGAKADKRLKLYKSIAASGGDGFEFTKLHQEELSKTIVKWLRQSGKSIRQSTLAQWIEFSGYFNRESNYTLDHFRNDVTKVVSYSTGEEILMQDIEATASRDAMTFIFDMLDAISERRRETALSILHNLLSDGESEFKILAILSSQLELMLCVKEMQNDGLTLPLMEQQLNIKSFRLKKALTHSRSFSVEKLRRALSRAYGIEETIKNGLLEPRLAFELLIADIGNI